MVSKPSLDVLLHQLDVLATFESSPTPTADLRAFVESFFHFHFGNGYFAQVYAITAIIGILILMGLAVVCRRLYEGNFWLVRIQEAQGSKYPLVIPNSILSFVFIEAIFGLLYIAYLWCQLGGLRWNLDSGGQGYWFITPWLVLFFGAFYGAVGTFYASPGILSRRRRVSSSWDVRKLIPSPVICNQILIAVPLINAASILVVAVMLGRSWHMAYQDMRRFADDLAAQRPTAAISTSQIESARNIWQGTIDAWWYASVGFYMWGGWAFLLLGLYLPAGAHLSHTVQVQINEQKSFKNSRFRNTSYAHSEAVARAATATPAIIPSGPAPVWDTASALEIADPPAANRTRRNREAEMEATRAAESIFYPPLKADRVSVQASETSSHINTLQSALRNILLMWSSISSAVLAYGVLCIWVASQINPAISKGPDDMTRLYEVYNSAAGWLACVFGGLNFVWVTSRTFEPVLDGLQLKHAGRTKTFREEVTTFFTSSRPNLGRPVLKPTGGRNRRATDSHPGTSQSQAGGGGRSGPLDTQGGGRDVELSIVEEVTSLGGATDDGLVMHLHRTKTDRSSQMLDRAYSETGDESESSAAMYAQKDHRHQQQKGRGDDDDPLSHVAELHGTDDRRSRGAQRVRYDTSDATGVQQPLAPAAGGQGSPSDSHWSLSQPSPSVSELKGSPFNR